VHYTNIHEKCGVFDILCYVILFLAVDVTVAAAAISITGVVLVVIFFFFLFYCLNQTNLVSATSNPIKLNVIVENGDANAHARRSHGSRYAVKVVQQIFQVRDCTIVQFFLVY
jgi:hypothetical protein